MAETYRTWIGAKSMSAQIKTWQEDEANPAIQPALQTVEKALRNLIEVCRQSSVAVPNVAMDMLKKYVLEELDKARLPTPEDRQIVAVHIEHSLKRREGSELVHGRAPHYNRCTVVAYQKDVGDNGQPTIKAVREIHVGDSDDPGINWETFQGLLSMWLTEYAERYGMGVDVSGKIRVIA